MANELKYAKEVNLEVAKNDDPQLTYTDDDDGADLTAESQSLIIAGSTDDIFNNPTESLTESDMTVTATTSKVRIPDSIGIGVWAYRWTFTDSSGNDITTHYGTLTII